MQLHTVSLVDFLFQPHRCLRDTTYCDSPTTSLKSILVRCDQVPHNVEWNPARLSFQEPRYYGDVINLEANSNIGEKQDPACNA